MEKLTEALQALKKLGEEHDRLTFLRRTNYIVDLMTAMGEFVDEKLSDAITAIEAALTHIEELEQRVEELETESKED